MVNPPLREKLKTWLKQITSYRTLKKASFDPK